MRERTPGSWELTVSAGLDPATGRYRRVITKIKTTSKREAKGARRFSDLRGQRPGLVR
ncbi:MAG: hypothetical protein ABIR32_17545 [Ilumatobacteraceae bacterium]